MDLDIKDVAELLDVTETTVQKWLTEGTIPGYRTHLHQWRFSRDEIEAWMMKRGEENEKRTLSFREQQKKRAASSPSKIGGIKPFNLFRAISRGQLYFDMPGESKEEVFRETMARFASHLDLDAEVITEMLLAREQLNPTALANGIAIPHARDFLLNKPYDVICVVFPRKPIAYGALDEKPVHTLFFLFASQDKRHLHLLAKIAHMSSQREMVGFLRQKPTRDALLDRIRLWESQLIPS